MLFVIGIIEEQIISEEGVGFKEAVAMTRSATIT
jgi:hypothetical protein